MAALVDLKANVEVSPNFPSSPSVMHVYSAGRKEPCVYICLGTGTLESPSDRTVACGQWWPCSASCVMVRFGDEVEYFRFSAGNEWTSASDTKKLVWNKKLDMTGSCLQIRTPVKSKRPRSAITPNISRFRMSVLPVDPLDGIHREFLTCMGLRVCRHAEVGRVLVTTRAFEDGEVVIYSRVQSFDVKVDEDVLDIIHPSHPSCSYILVPRIKKLYYNRDSFSDADPIASGDIWYLVNHSKHPNVDTLIRKEGIQFKAKRAIQANEPVVWLYPPSFFGKDEQSVDLPQSIIPDETVCLGG